MIIDTTNDELLINGQRWQRGGYLQATAYATDQINITARDGRVIGKALQWDAIYDQDKNLFGLNRDGVVTALTTVFNSRVKSPYNLEALRDVQDGTASYGDILIWSAPGEWQYDALTQYHHAYNSEAATLRAGATATTELYYTAQADGDGLSESAQSNTPAEGYQIVRKLYYAEAAQADPDTGTWVQFAALDPNTTYASAKATLLAYLKERTGGTVPISLKMTWEEELEPTLLLDTYTGAAAAYSLRKLRTAYSGSAIRVRRASDNAEQDIGFDIEGNLNTAALASFCSGTDGFVKTWYCQSGNANDATQTTTANQPKIVSSGSVITENGKPAVEFNVGFHFDLSNYINPTLYTYTLSGVARPDVNDNLMINLTDATELMSWTYGRTAGTLTARTYDGATISDKSTATTINTQFLGVSIHDFTSPSTSLYINGGAATGTNAGRGDTAQSTIGDGPLPSLQFDGAWQEIVLWDTDQSSNRTGIESNINTFYSIY